MRIQLYNIYPIHQVQDTRFVPVQFSIYLIDRWQKSKDIVSTHPEHILPKRTDIRQLRKYRVPYLDDRVVNDRRHALRLQPPSSLPSLTHTQIGQLMTSHTPQGYLRKVIDCNFYA